MKIIDFFERAYVINLPHRIDRRQHIIQELEKAGMPLSANKVEIFSGIQPAQAKNFPSIGTLGCFLSHFTILKQAKKDGLANVLIMEDDLFFTKQLHRNHTAIVEQLRSSSWDFVYLGHEEDINNTSPFIIRPPSAGVMKTHFYAANNSLFNRLILFLEEIQERPEGHPDGGPMSIDGAYSTFRAQNPDLVTLIASPSLGWQRSSVSDITANAWYDHVPGVNQLANLAREIKQLLRRELQLKR